MTIWTERVDRFIAFLFEIRDLLREIRDNQEKIIEKLDYQKDENSFGRTAYFDDSF